MAVTTTLKIGGVTVPRGDGTGVRLAGVKPLARNGVPLLRFAVRSSPWVALPDPFLGKSAELLIDFGDGLGNISVFKGDVWSRQQHDSGRAGFVREYQATGMRDRADRVAVFDEDTGSDTLTFNARPGATDYRASRTGRTVGQAILETLSQPTTVTALSALGVGGYVGVGTGAAAHCVMVNRAVSSIVVDLPGSGYDIANRVSVYLFGGGGSGAAAGNYTVSSGGIATIPVASGGTGYLSPPTVVLSQLPAITVADLLAIDMVPTRPISLSGERILNAVEGVLEDRNPNYWVDVEPDGTIRFHDQRKFGNTALTLTGGGTPARAAIVVPVVVKKKVEALWIADGGLGYSGAPTVAISDPDGSGASYTLTIDGNGSVSGFAKVAAGTGYSGGRAPLVIDDAPLLPQSFTISCDVRNCYQRVTARGATYNEPVCLKTSDGSLIENFAHDGLDSDTAKLYWKQDDFADPFTDGSTALATAVRSTTGTFLSATISNPGYGYNPAVPPVVTITPAPGTGALFKVNVSGGVITSVTVLSGGAGYDGPTPTFRVVGGGGSGATFTVMATGGVITAVAVTAGGSGYLYAPQGIVTGLGAGSGATAHAVVAGANNGVSSIVRDAAGSGYTATPIIKIAGHGGAGARSSGACVATTTTTLTLTPADATSSWAANYWDQTTTGVRGVILVTYVDGVGVQHRSTARVVSNTALTAGGTSVVTIDIALDNLNYVSYDLVGTATPASKVWRSYLPGAVALRTILQEQFSFPISVGNADQTMALLKTHMFAKVVYRPSGSTTTVESEWGMTLNRDTGEILFDKPVLMAYGSAGALAAGGTFVDGIPEDIQVWIAVRSAALTSTYPLDVLGVPQYAGDSFDNEGLQFTKLLTISEWTDPGQSAAVAKIAKEYHDTVKDAVVEGPMLVDHAARAFFHPGLAADFRLLDGTTCGLESAKVPVVTADISWTSDGATRTTTNATVSSRRSHYSGSTAIPPSQQSREPWPSGDGNSFGAPAGFGDATQGGMAGPMLGQFGGAMGSSAGEFQGEKDQALGGFSSSS